MSQIEALDKSLFWWINSHYATPLDWILWTFSQPWSWAVVIFVVYIFTTLRHDRKNWLWVLAGIGLCFLLADQISNTVIKDGVQRLRPCYMYENGQIVKNEAVRLFHTGRGGHYGFVSSHAANAFAIAMFISLMYGGKKCDSRYKSPALPYILMAWAAIVAYSRVYLGKHYPGDVACGALLGLGVGALLYFAISKIKLRISSKSTA